VQRYRILIVDDEDSLREALRRWFERHGFQVYMARDGVEAVTQCAAAAVDLVLMDLEMPRMNGDEAAARIRRSHPGMPIVILTGAPRAGETLTASEVDGVLMKPVPLEDLHSRVCQVLAKA